MTTAFQDPASSRSFSLDDAWVIATSTRPHNAMPKLGTTEKYFGGVAPISQYEKAASRWMDRAATVWFWPEAILLRESHYIESAFAHGPQIMDRTSIVDAKSATPLSWPTRSHHSLVARRELAEIIPDSVTVKQVAPKLDAISQWSDSGAKPFVLLERARHLLSKQRIRDARSVLQLGAASYPEDEKIATLLRAISPGQVKRSQGSAPNREQEMDWLLKHGHKFRGRWVALRGNVLVASADTLDKLIAKVKKLGDGHVGPVIQKIAPE